MHRFNIKPGQFRVYCKVGTQQSSRELTAQEIADQVSALYKLMDWARTVAITAMKKNGISEWSVRDRYKLTKLVHGLPGLVKTGLAAVTLALKRPPRDWSEYKSAILGGVRLDAGTERYRAQFARTFANAESVANTIPGEDGSGRGVV